MDISAYNSYLYDAVVEYVDIDIPNSVGIVVDSKMISVIATTYTLLIHLSMGVLAIGIAANRRIGNSAGQ